MADTHSDILDLWPSKAAIAEDTGAKLAAVWKWHARGRIPAEHWLAVVSAAEARGITGVTLELLARIAAHSAPPTSQDAAE